VVSRASGLVFIFWAPGLVFSVIEGIESHFHVLRALTHFRRYRGRRVPFSCLSLSDSFSAVPSALCPIFMFCAPEIDFGGTEGVRSRFPLPNMFFAVWRASGPVFKFCAPGLVFGGTEGVGSHFHVLRSRSRFPRCQGCQVPVFMFYAPVLVFGSIEGVRFRFHFLRSRTRFRR
jgi:hypothetical protein